MVARVIVMEQKAISINTVIAVIEAHRLLQEATSVPPGYPQLYMHNTFIFNAIKLWNYSTSLSVHSFYYATFTFFIYCVAINFPFRCLLRDKHQH